MKEHDRIAIRVALQLAIAAVLIAIFALQGCATKYDACKDPKSHITFLPWQCHATYNPEDHQ